VGAFELETVFVCEVTGHDKIIPGGFNMHIAQFEKQLRDLQRREPFQPFQIVINDGRTILVDEPAVAFGGGRGGFIRADQIVEFFDCEQVVEFRPAPAEPRS
jgi:hypothetical protein